MEMCRIVDWDFILPDVKEEILNDTLCVDTCNISICIHEFPLF